MNIDNFVNKEDSRLVVMNRLEYLYIRTESSVLSAQRTRGLIDRVPRGSWSPLLVRILRVPMGTLIRLVNVTGLLKA